MNKYIKKPIPIEAVQLTTKNVWEVYAFINGAPKLDCRMAEDRWGEYVNIVRNEGMKLKTLESDGQTQTADIGDWILKGIQGEFYPCKPDIFKETYDLIK